MVVGSRPGSDPWAGVQVTDRGGVFVVIQVLLSGRFPPLKGLVGSFLLTVLQPSEPFVRLGVDGERSALRDPCGFSGCLHFPSSGFAGVGHYTVSAAQGLLHNGYTLYQFIYTE